MELSASLPDNWKTLVVGLGAMITLAGLDFLGAICAKEWAERGRLLMFCVGLLAFIVLFVVYARILKVAELSTVTIGWVVFLQVGLLLLDAIHYDVAIPRGKVLAVVAILMLQIYLIAAPNGNESPVPKASQSVTETSLDITTPKPTIPKPNERRFGRRLGPRAV